MRAGAVEASLEQLPLLLTVEEAAGILRIGRTLAYELARRDEASGGTAGLPVMRLGGCLRVPTLGGGSPGSTEAPTLPARTIHTEPHKERIP